jgi:hypothetical protein
MNGGAWWTVDGVKVDVLYRDPDVVQHWTRQAEQGLFEVDDLLGYLAGSPMYAVVGELALPKAPPSSATASAAADPAGDNLPGLRLRQPGPSPLPDCADVGVLPVIDVLEAERHENTR